jgi:hypothetical protein
MIVLETRKWNKVENEIKNEKETEQTKEKGKYIRGNEVKMRKENRV